MANGQLGMFADIGSMAHQYGILLCTKLMGEHLRLLIADLQGMATIVDETVGSLRPLQDDVRAMLGMIGEETTIQPHALLFQNTHSHLDACLTNLSDAPTLHYSKGVDATHNNLFYPLTNNEISTRWRLTIMGTRLQRHVDGGIFQQRFILRTY